MISANDTKLITDFFLNMAYSGQGEMVHGGIRLKYRQRRIMLRPSILNSTIDVISRDQITIYSPRVRALLQLRRREAATVRMQELRENMDQLIATIKNEK